MPLPRRLALPVLPVLLACLVALPAHARQVRLIEAGIDCPSDDAIDREAAPDTAAGFVDIVENLELDAIGRVVPMRLGYGMGISTQLKQGLPAQVTMVTTHPPMGPEGITRQTYTATLQPDRPHLRVYRFDFDYELLPGTWTLGVEVGGEMVVEVPFQVVDGPVPGLEDLCARALSS